MSHFPFSDRAQALMKALVETYLRDGQPVGSKTLVDATNLNISSATVRNVMVELEELGLVQTPHTSAGRIPTTLGFRLFVDQLLTIQTLQDNDIEQLRQGLQLDQDTGTLLTNASTLLSEVTHMAGLVRVPKRQVQTLKHIEFLPLGSKRVLAVLVLSDREVQNRILFCDRDYSRDELQQAANYVTQHFSGKDLRSAQRELFNQLNADRSSLDRLLQSTLKMAEAALHSEPAQDDYHVAGQYNLLNLTGGEHLQSLRELFEAFARKQQILDILDKCLNADGVQIFIGQETGHPALENFSVVSAPYQIDGEKVGVLAVVGPTRMASERVIPVVDITARLLSSALSDSQS
jgi:heat-inducible transcriptional repressor